MPNPKSGTVTMKLVKLSPKLSKVKSTLKLINLVFVHTTIGKASFSADKIKDNAVEFINMINKLKPVAAKGTYIKSIYLSSTMSHGISSRS